MCAERIMVLGQDKYYIILAEYRRSRKKWLTNIDDRLKKSGNLDAIQIIRVKGGTLEDSFLDEGDL